MCKNSHTSEWSWRPSCLESSHSNLFHTVTSRIHLAQLPHDLLKKWDAKSCIVQRREEDDCKNENAILMFNYIRKNGAFTHKLWHFHEKNVKSAKSQIHGKSLTWIVLSSWALGALTFSGSLEALITKVSMAGLKATIEAATWGSTFKLIQLSTRTVPVIIKFVNCQLIKNNSHHASNSCTFISFDGKSLILWLIKDVVTIF